MDITILIQIIINISTFITSLFALFTLIEMVKQRRSAMMPSIFIKSSYNITIFRENIESNNTIKMVESIWCETDEVDSLKNKDFTSYPQYSIGLFNVGIAYATNIRYEWEFDISSCINLLQDYLDTYGITIQYKDIRKGLTFCSKNQIVLTKGLKNDDYKISFLSPSQEALIQLPVDFTILFSMMLFSFVDEFFEEKKIGIKDADKRVKEFPPLNLIVRYTDISGKQYKKKYKFVMKSILYSIEQSQFTLICNED